MKQPMPLAGIVVLSETQILAEICIHKPAFRGRPTQATFLAQTTGWSTPENRRPPEKYFSCIGRFTWRTPGSVVKHAKHGYLSSGVGSRAGIPGVNTGVKHVSHPLLPNAPH